VRVELVRGQSSLGAWETDAKAAGARVEVGSDPECAWRIVASGVQAYHVELYWDGEVLWVAAGDDCSVKVDGMAIDDWCATAHGSRVEFGDAQLRVVTQAVDLSSVVDRTDHGLNNPSLVTRATGILGEKTQLDPGGPRFADDAPPVYAVESGVPKPSHEDQIVTRMNVSPKRRLDEVAIAKTAVDPPRQAQPIFGGAAASPNDTRLVPLPGGPRPAGAAPEPVRRAPPPRLGNRGRAVRASAPPKPNGAEAPAMNAAMAAPPAFPNAHAMQAQHGHPMPPASPHAMQPAMPPHAMPTAPVPLTAPLSPPPPQPMPMPMQAPIQAPMQPSAFPNVPSDAGIVAAGAAPTPMQLGPALPPEAPSFTAPPAVVATAKPKKKMSMPPRTWIMLSVTVLAACFVLLMDDGEEAVVVDDTPRVVQVDEAPETQPSTSETAMQAPEEPRSLIGLPDTIEVAEPEDPTEAAETVEEETGDTLARRAADALMNGDHRGAMLLYRELVLLEPENEAYRSIALMIERELRARCRDGVDPNGEPCEAP
jgi:hypothetical protein